MSRALAFYSTPLNPWLLDDTVSEICVNRPGEVWVERAGAFEKIGVEEITGEWVSTWAGLVAEYNQRRILPQKPLLSATLPGGARCQVVLPPACDPAQTVVSIRKPAATKKGLASWFDQGLLKRPRREDVFAGLRALKQAGEYEALMKKAIESRCNIVVSGQTSSAKTTFLNSCLWHIPAHERLITIEDTRESASSHENMVHLLYTDNNEGGDRDGVSLSDLLKASLRLRPDRLFLSELRGQQAYPFLRASISGHPGAITTLHADSIEHARLQLQFMLAESRELMHAPEQRLKALIDTSVDVMVQMGREGARRAPMAIHIKGEALDD